MFSMRSIYRLDAKQEMSLLIKWYISALPFCALPVTKISDLTGENM